MVKFLLGFLVFMGCTVTAQNILVLEKARAGKIHMYRVHNEIRLKTRSSNQKIEGPITWITDSSIMINSEQEILIRDIAKVYRGRWGFSLLQKFLVVGGVLYTAISLLNGTINNDDPIVPSKTLKISGGMVLAGLALTPLTTRSHTIKMTKWKLKILDFTD